MKNYLSEEKRQKKLVQLQAEFRSAEGPPNTTKILPIWLYGGFIILSGLFLLMADSWPFHTIRFSLGAMLGIASVIAFAAAFASRRKQVQMAYHQMHALAMLLYVLYLIFWSHSITNLVDSTAFLLFYYAFSEITFSAWLFNLEQKTINPVIVLRSLLGLAIGIGTVVAMMYPDFTLELYGMLFFLVGFNVMGYVPSMQNRPSNLVAEPSTLPQQNQTYTNLGNEALMSSAKTADIDLNAPPDHNNLKTSGTAGQGR